jgi:phenylacetate-CoA ligase
MAMDETLERINARILYARTHCRFYEYLPTAPLTDMEEFKALPFVSAEDISERGNSMICCSASKIRRMVSSGTTGTRKRLAFSNADIEATVAFFRDGMHTLCDSGDTVAIFMPGQTPDGVGALLAEGLLRFGAQPKIYGPISDYADAAGFCQKERPAIMVGIPAQMRRLALTAPEARPKRVLLSADYVASSLRRTVERLWSCEVYTHYGLTESGLGCAVETPALDGLHVRNDIYIETVDGEIVITTLDREAMPLIRYRTGDFGELLPNGNVGGVFGRKFELAKPTPIYELDELLFSCDEVTDFTAELRGGVLTVSVLGSVAAAKELLALKNVKVVPGKGLFSTGTEKRTVIAY